MKLILIWNKNSIAYIKQLAKLNYPDITDEQICQITSKDELEKLNFKNQTSIDIWILVELFWDDIHLTHGYQIALDLLISSDYTKENTLQISFFSFLSRQYHFKTQKNLLLTFPKCFPHNLLPIETINKIEIPVFQKSRWKYIRKYGFSVSGIWDKLKHDFDDVLSNPELTDNLRVIQFLNELKKLSDIFGVKLTGILNSINNKEEYLYQKDKIQIIIKESLQTDLSVGNYSKLPNYNWKPRLLVVEDNISFLEKMVTNLESGFKITSFSDGLKAINELKSNALDYDGLLCDLELLESAGYEQLIQGIDIIEYAKKNFPHLVINVITSLPKSGIKYLLPYLENNNIRYKSSFENFIPTNEWFEYLSELREAIKLKYKYKSLLGPGTAIWEMLTREENQGGGLKIYYYNFKKDDPTDFNIFWAEILDSLQKVLDEKTKIATEFPSPKTINGFAIFEEHDEKKHKKVRKYLRILLLHRLFWLKKLYTGKFQSVYKIDIEDSKYFSTVYDFYGNTKAKKSFSDYFNLLGFSVDKLQSAYKVKFNTLFPEEIEYLKEVSDIDDVNKYPNLFSLFYNILKIIHQSSDKDFNKNNYKTAYYPNDIKDITELFNALAKETPKRQLENRPFVINKIDEYKENNETEYALLSDDLHKLISKAMYAIDVH